MPAPAAPPRPRLASPFEACAPTLGKLPFSPNETASQRSKTAGTCCYLTRCQLSYGY